LLGGGRPCRAEPDPASTKVEKPMRGLWVLPLLRKRGEKNFVILCSGGTCPPPAPHLATPLIGLSKAGLLKFLGRYPYRDGEVVVLNITTGRLFGEAVWRDRPIRFANILVVYGNSLFTLRRAELGRLSRDTNGRQNSAKICLC